MWTRRLLITLACLLAPAAARAQQQDDLPRIRITDPNRNLLKMAVPNAAGDADLARQATQLADRNLRIIGVFQVLDPASFPPALQAEGAGFSSVNWSTVGAQAVVKMQARRAGDAVSLEGRLFQTGRGDTAVLAKTYRGADLKPLVHEWCNDVVQHFTGQRGVFGSRIAFAMTGRSQEIGTVSMDGGDAATVTKMGSEAVLPAFSPNGAQIAFTAYTMGGADLWVVSAAGGRARRISSRSGMNSGAAWFADGSTLAVTLSHEGNPEIYRLSASNGNILKKLTDSNGADLSPSLSPDGAQMAFVSDRQGTAQIYIAPTGGGAAKRVTFQGNQNTTPRWNPNRDKPLIAFTGRDERLAFDIFVYDVRTGKIQRVTQVAGTSNFDPAWSPDGRLLVYGSSRGGLWVQNVDTQQEIQIYKGGARNPSWGPPPSQSR